MRKPGIQVLIFTFVLSVVCWHCSNDSTEQKSAAKDAIQLTYWCSSNQNEIDLAKELVDQWNREHSRIKVLLQPIPASQSSEEVLLAAIAGGTTPDLCSNMWPGAMDDFTSAGGLIALDSFPEFRALMEKRVPLDLLESFRAPDGHYYQIPWKTNPIMVMYNVGIFRDAGITDIPRTYSEYLAAAAKVTRDTDGNGTIDRWMGYRDIKPIWWQRFFDFYTLYITASGGQTLFDDGEIIFDNPAAVRVFSFFQEIYRHDYFPKTTFQGDQFLAQKLATQFCGPWNVIHVEKFRTPDLEYDIFEIPVPDDYSGPRYTYGDHKNISIFSTTKYPKEAWEFAKHLVTPASDLRLLELCSQIPLRKNLTTDPLYHSYFAENPKMIKYAEQAPFTRGVDGAADLKEIFDGISQEYEACAIYNLKTPQEAVQDAARRARVIIEWNRSR